jgi:PAS domain S-box-containing protein
MELFQDVEEINEAVDNASVGIIFLNSDGFINYANLLELDVLGYTKDEYVGHHASEFTDDEGVVTDVMSRLNRKETLKNYPISLKAKQGIKHFLLNSTTYTKDDKLVHSRCFFSNISKLVYDVCVEHSEYYN